MSNPVTNADTEAVLSAIRRMVTDAPQPVASPSAQLARRLADRLVLTPSQKVAPVPSPEETETDEWPAPATGPEAPPRDEPDATARLSATIARLEAALGVGPGPWEPDGSEVAPTSAASTDTPEAPLFRSRLARPEAQEPLPSAPLAAPSEAFQPPPVKTVIAGGAAPVAGPTATPAAVPTATPAAVPTATPAAVPTATPAAPSAAFPPPLVEAAIAGAAPTDALPSAPSAAFAGQGHDQPSASGPAEWTVDEAMLRDLVIQIVREELQGALGERMTRNVRKLVRREIHRVLSSEEFS
jgi:hypothetical protein